MNLDKYCKRIFQLIKKLDETKDMKYIGLVYNVTVKFLIKGKKIPTLGPKKKISELELNSFIEGLYRLQKQIEEGSCDVHVLYTDTAFFLTQYHGLKPSNEEVDTFMESVDEEEALYWCDGVYEEGGCDCEGCVNNGANFPWDRKHWESWKRRNKV